MFNTVQLLNYLSVTPLTTEELEKKQKRVPKKTLKGLITKNINAGMIKKDESEKLILSEDGMKFIKTKNKEEADLKKKLKILSDKKKKEKLKKEKEKNTVDSKSTKPIKKTKKTKTVVVEKSAKPTKSTKSTKSVKPTKPTKSTKSEKSSKTTKDPKVEKKDEKKRIVIKAPNQIVFTKYEKAIIRILKDHDKKKTNFVGLTSNFIKNNKVNMTKKKLETQLRIAVKRCVEKKYLEKDGPIIILSKKMKNYVKFYGKSFNKSFEFGNKKSKNVSAVSITETDVEPVSNQTENLENKEE